MHVVHGEVAGRVLAKSVDAITQRKIILDKLPRKNRRPTDWRLVSDSEARRMTVERIINKVTQYCSWLYYRRWEKSELLAMAILTGLGLLILAIRAHRKAAADARRFRARPPVFDFRLSEHKRSHY